MIDRTIVVRETPPRRFGNIAVALVIVVIIALPLLMLSKGLNSFTQIFFRGSAAVPVGSSSVGMSNGGIVTKAMPDKRADEVLKLADLSAERYEAGGTLRRLRFVGVQFTAGDDRMTSPAERGRRDMVLDLNMPKDLGVVMIAAEPINWAVNNRGTRERARIGFEGAAPFGIRAEPGTVSGFRIGAFGATRNAYPVDLVDETAANRIRFCTALLHWGNHFGVEFERMEYVLLNNPSSLTVNAETTIGGGRIGAHYSGSTLRNFCYPSPSSRGGSSGRGNYNPVTRRWN